MINESLEIPKVVVPPFGLLSPAVSVHRNVEVGEFPVVRNNSPIDIKSINWELESDFNNSTTIYSSPAQSSSDANTFTVFLMVKGSNFNLLKDPDQPEHLLNAFAESALQKAIETEFWKRLSAMTATSATVFPAKTKVGVALAESTFAKVSAGEQGVVHAPKNFAALYRGKMNDDLLLDTVGTPIVAGGGYNATDNKIYITGPVNVYISEPTSFIEVTRNDNSYTYMQEYTVAVSFMDGPVSADIDLSLE